MQPTAQKNNAKQRKTIAIVAVIAVVAIALAVINVKFPFSIVFFKASTALCGTCLNFSLNNVPSISKNNAFLFIFISEYDLPGLCIHAVYDRQ